LILIVSWILMDFAGELPGTYYSDYVLQLGGSPSALGLITFSSMLALASVQFPGGYLADKYGRRWLVSTMTFGVALSYLLYTFAPSWEYILLGESIRSLFLIYQPALNAMFADSLSPEKRGMGFSILTLVMSVATTPAPVAALYLVTAYGSLTGMRIAYAIVTALFFAGATVRLKLKESMASTERLDLRHVLRSYPLALKEGVGVWRKVPRSMFFLFVSQLIQRFAFAMTMTLFLVYAFYVLQIGGVPNPALPPQQDPALQLARERWGYISIVLFVSMIVLSFPTGSLIDRIGRKKPSVLSSLVLIPGVLLFVYGNYLSLYLSVILFSFGQLLGFSAYQAMFADLVPKSQRGKATGSMNFFTNISMAIGGIAGGLLYDNVSPQLPFLLMPVFIVLATSLVFVYVQEPKPEERQA